MNAHHLGIDHEELSLSIIPRVEESFGISFQSADLADVYTFGQLCAAVQTKLAGQVTADCTSQQAFYKARQVVQKHTSVKYITPNTALTDILPAGLQRRQIVAAMEQELHMKLDILTMSPGLIGACCLALLTSLACLFFYPLLGFTGMAFAIAGLHLAGRLGTTLRIYTMRELAECMSTRYYRTSRRNPQSVNLREIVGTMRHLFNKEYSIALHELTPDAII
ncbi:acyl carrier protein [Hymenobacter wooponensis]|uniref:Uncharacterized protein n=1 Tax=Hymenobacter wooponensis TaxID=1525360 RepID=A0A4Z0MM15_9BACT|nr:hypothetical protein [Hymenobacter wooponensis]TGD80225.1 hypothetical protein EU557_10275 [Hymenobacter wooponensis]